MKGTKFQIKVWKYLKTIPRGKIKTYKQVAKDINRPKEWRTGSDKISISKRFVK